MASLFWYCDTVSGKSKGQPVQVSSKDGGGSLKQIKCNAPFKIFLQEIVFGDSLIYFVTLARYSTVAGILFPCSLVF